MDSSTIAIVITVITIVSFILEKIPLAMTAMIASLAMGILVPEMKLSDIYSGFASNNVIMVAGMCIVGDALFKTGMANKIGQGPRQKRRRQKRAHLPHRRGDLLHSDVRLPVQFRHHRHVDAPDCRRGRQVQRRDPFQDGHSGRRHCLCRRRWRHPGGLPPPSRPPTPF